jgi:hypothetical protein
MFDGLRTYFRNWKKGRSGFRQAYEPIYPLLNDLFFVEQVVDSCFKFPWDDDTAYDDFAKSHIERDGNYGLFPSDVLIKLDRYVADDWNAI